MIRILINAFNRIWPESVPITYSMESRYKMTSEQIRLYEGMAVIPHDNKNNNENTFLDNSYYESSKDK